MPGRLYVAPWLASWFGWLVGSSVGAGRYADYLARQDEVLARVSWTCEYKRFMLKHDAACAANATAWSGTRGAPAAWCVRELFVTGCGGTGTHAIQSMIAAMGVWSKAVHEDAQAQPDVLVSWASRDGRYLGVEAQEYARWSTRSMRKPMVSWANKQARSPCAFRRLAHVVRHPLKVFSSSVAFGQCVECWVHIEEFVLPPFSPRASRHGMLGTAPQNASSVDLTSRTRASIWANRESKANQRMGGRAWSAESVTALIEGFAAYWLAWNSMIAPVADYRFTIETASYADLCAFAGVPRPRCERGAAEAVRTIASKPHVTHGGDALTVTWETLDAIDADLSSEVWKLAQSYGYDRAPPDRLPNNNNNNNKPPGASSPTPHAAATARAADPDPPPPWQPSFRTDPYFAQPASNDPSLPRTPTFPPRVHDWAASPQDATTRRTPIQRPPAGPPRPFRPPWEAPFPQRA